MKAAILLAGLALGCGASRPGGSVPPEIWTDDDGVHALNLPPVRCGLALRVKATGASSLDYSGADADGVPVPFYLSPTVEPTGIYYAVSLLEPVRPGAVLTVRIKIDGAPAAFTEAFALCAVAEAEIVR